MSSRLEFNLLKKMLIKQMIMLIQTLPEICQIKISTDYQRDFLYLMQTEWEWSGKRLDFLMNKQLGYRPNDPLEYFYSSLFQNAEESVKMALKENIQYRSNYLFALFQAINDSWEAIKHLTNQIQKPFSFVAPRCFFLEICKEMAQLEISDAFDSKLESYSGSPLTLTRQKILLTGKILRGSHPDQDNVRKKLLGSPWWIDFAIGAILTSQGRYLKTNYFWKQLIKAQKEAEQLSKQKRINLLWNQGIPINSQNKKRFNQTLTKP